MPLWRVREGKDLLSLTSVLTPIYRRRDLPQVGGVAIQIVGKNSRAEQRGTWLPLTPLRHRHNSADCPLVSRKNGSLPGHEGRQATS